MPKSNANLALKGLDEMFSTEAAFWKDARKIFFVFPRNSVGAT